MPKSGLEAEDPSIPDFYKEDELKYHGKQNRGVQEINFHKGNIEKMTTEESNDDCEFRYPPGCLDQNCDYKASWSVMETDPARVIFNLESSVTDKWTGIGFSDNMFMVSFCQILLIFIFILQ